MSFYKIQIIRTKVETITVEVPGDSDRHAIQQAISDASSKLPFWGDAEDWTEVKAPEYEAKVLGVSGA